MTPFFESTYSDLYDSTVAAFPHTTKRQHATQPVKVSRFEIVPFVGMHTLFIKAEAANEDRRYNPIILIKDVQYEYKILPGVIEIVGSDNLLYHLHRPSMSDNDIRVRCDCPDHRWRFRHWNYLDHSLYGRDSKKYEAKYRPGSSNPTQAEGMCKHLMKMAEALYESGLIGD